MKVYAKESVVHRRVRGIFVILTAVAIGCADDEPRITDTDPTPACERGDLALTVTTEVADADTVAVFSWAPTCLAESLSVTHPCTGELLWQIAGTGPDLRPPIKYGALPTGAEEMVEPAVLANHCYKLQIAADDTTWTEWFKPVLGDSVRCAPAPCPPPPAPFIEPLTPEFVRDNIKAALEAPTIDPNYEDSLSDPVPGFIYIPDRGAEAVAPPGFFVAWDKDREVRFMRVLLEGGSAPKSVQMLFTQFEDTGHLPGTNEARYEVSYEFTLFLPASSLDALAREERYCGRAFWDLEGGDRNFWTLKQWEDLEPLPSPTEPCRGTMGLLRALTGQGN